MTSRSADLILSAPRVFTATGAAVIDDGAVAVADGAIAAVGRRADVAAECSGEEIHLAGSTLLPGLVDSHEHLMGSGRFAEGTGTLREPESMYALVFADACARTLRRGVTTVRVPGSYAGVDLVVRQAISEGLARGPRLVCAGLAVTMTGGHGHGVGIEADGPAACARAARSQLALGIDFVKVMASGGVGVVRPGEDPTHPELTVEEMRAVVDVATAAGRPVAAHADGVQGITNSLEAGISCIEHGIYLTPDHARHMAAHGVVLVPTLSTMTAIAGKTEELGLPPVWKPIAEAILPVHRASFQAALDAGVTFAAGTDSYGDIVDEIIEFTTYGISSADAIRAATAGGAAIARSDRFGTLEVGKDADVIAVPGDPLEDLEALRDVRLVVARGVVEHLDDVARA